MEYPCKEIAGGWRHGHVDLTDRHFRRADVLGRGRFCAGADANAAGGRRHRVAAGRDDLLRRARRGRRLRARLLGMDAAEGTVQWDTHKRLIAILDRQNGRKLPVIINSWGESNLNVSTSLGRILRGRGIDTMAGPTDVEACHGKAEAECFALKRLGGPLDAKIKTPDTVCDLA